MTSLADHLIDSIPEPVGEKERAAFRITSIEQAMWAARKMARAEARHQKIVADHAAEIDKMNAWLEAEVAAVEPSLLFFENLLKDWHEREMRDAVLDAGGRWDRVKNKTRDLVDGVAVVARKKPDEWVYDAEDLFLAWAAENRPELVRHPEPPPPPPAAPDKNAVKSAGFAVTDDGEVVADGGELVPGLRVVQGVVDYTVELAR